MAINIFALYGPVRAGAPTADYPVGSIKNESVPGTNDGTPLDQDWGNDYAGFDAALFAAAGITPDGNPDTAQGSQRLEAITKVSGRVFETVSSMVASTQLNAGDTVSTKWNNSTSKVGGAIYDIVTAGEFGGVPDGYGDHYITGNSLVAVLRKPGRNILQYGVANDGVTDDTVAAQAAINSLSAPFDSLRLLNCKILVGQLNMPAVRHISLIPENASILGMATGTYQHVIDINEAWQSIEGDLTIDTQFNPSYTCALQVNNGYGKFTGLNFKKTLLPVRIGTPNTSPFSLSEMEFSKITFNQCAQTFAAHGIFTVLKVSQSVLPSGEDAFWTGGPYDVHGVSSYGARVYIDNCTCNGGADTTLPFITIRETVYEANNYIGSVYVDSCDIELSRPLCLIENTSVTTQNSSQAFIVTGGTRIDVFLGAFQAELPLIATDDNFYGVVNVDQSNRIRYANIPTQPIFNIGANTVCKIADEACEVSGNKYGRELYTVNGLFPQQPYKNLMECYRATAQVINPGVNTVIYNNTRTDINGKELFLNEQLNTGTGIFTVPPGGLSNVEVTVDYALATAPTVGVLVWVEVFFSGGSITRRLAQTQPAPQQGNLIVKIPRLDENSTIKFIIFSQEAGTINLNVDDEYKNDMTVSGTIDNRKEP